MSNALRKIRRQQERKSADNPLKVIQGLSNLNGLSDLSGKIDSFILAANKMEGLIEDLDGAEGLLESVTSIKNTFESLVRRQDRCESVVKEILRLLHQGEEGIDSKLKKLEDSLGDHVE
jgi:hypothetical protein